MRSFLLPFFQKLTTTYYVYERNFRKYSFFLVLLFVPLFSQVITFPLVCVRNSHFPLLQQCLPKYVFPPIFDYYREHYRDILFPFYFNYYKNTLFPQIFLVGILAGIFPYKYLYLISLGTSLTKTICIFVEPPFCWPFSFF